MSTFSSFFSGGGGGDSIHPAVRGNVVTGIFGTGENVQFFINSGTFVVPTGITSVRVRLWSAGSRGGGGFAIKTVTGLTPGSSVAVTVGFRGQQGSAGGSSSFGPHVSATGAIDATPGLGTGGDFNSQGGNGATSSGGGAAGIFGDGGDTQGRNGNAGGGQNDPINPGGNGISGRGGNPTGVASGSVGTNGEHGEIRSLDYIGTGGGASGNNSNGANGGGSGQNNGTGGFPAGGGMRLGGNGLVIVEF